MDLLPPALLEKYELTKVFKVSDARDFMILDVAALVHAGDMLGAGQRYAAYITSNTKQPAPKLDNEADCVRVVTQLLHWCLNNDRYWLAARILWTESQFDARPQFAQDVFEAWSRHSAISLMGSASASKSYSSGVWLLLDWIRDPEYTCVKVLGPTEAHLKDNLFTHIVNLHENASLSLPGQTGDLWIGLDRKNRFGSISGVIVPVGGKAAGRLQGTKAGNKKRKKPHPIFGSTGRLRVFLDESEKIPIGIWKDIDNIFSNATGLETFKIGLAFNPENQAGESALRSEPRDGWRGFDIDSDYKWVSKRGWYTVRLDGSKSENVVEGVTIFSGLQTKEGFDRIVENAGGTNSPGYYTMCRAAFPPMGAEITVFTQSDVDQSLGTFTFMGRTQAFGACDLALEGGDAPIFVLGEVGQAIGFRRAPTLTHPQGEMVEFRSKDGEQITRPAAQVMQLFKLETGNSVFMAGQLKAFCERCDIQPQNFMIDRTGNGQGTYDILTTLWENTVMGVNYSEGASESRILVEDKLTCKEEFDRVHTELYFALKKWMRHHLVKVSPIADYTKAFGQLTQRRYMTGKVNKIEKKKDFKDRNNGKSPDESDALTLFVHAVRKSLGVVPSMQLSSSEGREATLGGFDLPGFGNSAIERPMWCYVDPTNRADREA
jgi:hypothetical protein